MLVNKKQPDNEQQQHKNGDKCVWIKNKKKGGSNNERNDDKIYTLAVCVSTQLKEKGNL